jgi:molybdenum cofactor biosynthesis enzyme
MQLDGKLETRQALAVAYSEFNETTIEEGKKKLLTDGEFFDTRAALAIIAIKKFCERHLRLG